VNYNVYSEIKIIIVEEYRYICCHIMTYHIYLGKLYFFATFYLTISYIKLNIIT